MSWTLPSAGVWYEEERTWDQEHFLKYLQGSHEIYKKIPLGALISRTGIRSTL